MGGGDGGARVGVRWVKRTEAGEDGPESGKSSRRVDGVILGPGPLSYLVLLLPPGGGVVGLRNEGPHGGEISLQVGNYPPPRGVEVRTCLIRN